MCMVGKSAAHLRLFEALAASIPLFELLLTQAAKVQTAQNINEYLGIGVMSEAMDGVAPELNPGWVHRRINTYTEVRLA